MAYMETREVWHSGPKIGFPADVVRLRPKTRLSRLEKRKAWFSTRHAVEVAAAALAGMAAVHWLGAYCWPLAGLLIGFLGWWSAVCDEFAP